MNKLSKLYNDIKTFSDGHGMVNEFVFLKNDKDLRSRNFLFRSMCLMASDADISRDLNSPVYTVGFSLIVLDKTLMDDDFNQVSIIEENLFVIAQLQDYLLQIGYDVEFDEIDLMNNEIEGETVCAALCDFNVTLERKPYVLGIDI